MGKKSDPLSRTPLQSYNVETEAEHIATAKRMKADGHTAKAIAKYLGVSRATLYRYLSEHGAA